MYMYIIYELYEIYFTLYLIDKTVNYNFKMNWIKLNDLPNVLFSKMQADHTDIDDAQHVVSQEKPTFLLGKM